MEPTLITSEPCAPYETHWYSCGAGGTGRLSGTLTTLPPAPRGMRGHSWGPERDDLSTQTCTARLPFVSAWWWRRRWACALNAYGKRCTAPPPHGWLDFDKWRRIHITPRQCIVEMCRPGMRETSLDFASC